MASTSLQTTAALFFDVSSLDAPAFTVDPRRRIVAWNLAAEQVLGYDASSVVGKDCCEVLFAGRIAAHALDAHWVSVQCRSPQRHAESCREVLASAANGSLRWVLLSALPAWTASRERVTIYLLHDTSAYHRLSAKVAAAGEDGASRLTAREGEVLTLLGCGLSTREIARNLGISGVTARNHVAHVLEKLGATSRLQAVVIAARLGLI